MKTKILGCILAINFQLSSFAQQAEKILSLTKAPKELGYYTEQSKLWKKEIDKNNKNADAWFNYYRASRYTIICSHNDTLKGKDRFKSLSTIIDNMEKAVPNSFEFNYLKWANSGNDLSKLSYLEKAHQINPSREECLIDFISAYEFQLNTEKRNEFAKKWYETGKVSTGYLNYNYNVLQSLAPNSILLTVGDNDSYPVWILQSVFGIRTDVQLINLNMLYMDDYYSMLAKLYEFEKLDLSKLSRDEYASKIVSVIANNKKQKKVFVALTADEAYSKAIADKLYLVGLAYEYSDSELDNIALLKRNMEKAFALDYLQNCFYLDEAAASIQLANANYLLPMITLYQHYQLSNETEKASHWKNLIKQVAQKSNQEESVKEYLKD
jgi:hypothetical protein